MNIERLKLSLGACLVALTFLALLLPACTSSTPNGEDQLECVCHRETACCDGCNPINVGEPCGYGFAWAEEQGGDAGGGPLWASSHLCGEYQCTAQGACHIQVAEGWCYDESVCHNTENSPLHCGQCGNACIWGEVCAQGECVEECPADHFTPYTNCDGSCVVLDHDYHHCGQCFSPCLPGQVCVAGACTDEGCDHDHDHDLELTECFGRCVDTGSDPAHCGGCNIKCQPNQVCADGECTDDDCPAGKSDCHGACVDLQTNNSHCGECGQTCTMLDDSTPTVCMEGECIVPAQTLTLEPQSAELSIDETVQLTTAVTPENATFQAVEWASSEPLVATVDSDGLVTALKAGEAEITASAARGSALAATCQITVLPPIAVASVTLSMDSMELVVGQTGTLTAAVLPEDAADKRVEWTSSNSEVATVTQDGLVEGTGPGSAVISVTTKDGAFTAECAVVVVIPVTRVEVEPSSMLIVPVGATGQLRALVFPENATDKLVNWTTINPEVATVDEEGLVTGVAVGETTVTATTRDGDYNDIATVFVADSLPGFALISPGTFTMGSQLWEVGRVDELENQHQVTITRQFLIGTTQVTQGEWQDLMGDNPSHFSQCGDRCPVENVSWHQALLYANALSAAEGIPQCFDCTVENGSDPVCKLKSRYAKPQDCPGYRLPTEAEWEYAARAGSAVGFHTGDITSETYCPNMDVAGWYYGNSGETTHEVGGKEPNHWGLYDMHGNVQEWVWDRYQQDLSEGELIDPCGPDTGSSRVLRGGSWYNHAMNCRAGYRITKPAHHRNEIIGFRLALSV